MFSQVQTRMKSEPKIGNEDNLKFSYIIQCLRVIGKRKVNILSIGFT